MIKGSRSIFLKCTWNKSCSWAALLKFWFQTDLGHENSTGFYMEGRQSLLIFLTIVTSWSRCTSNFYALICQNLTGEFMRKFMERLETSLLIAEADRVLCHLPLLEAYKEGWKVSSDSGLTHDSGLTFRSSISTGKQEQLLSLMWFFFRFLKSSVVYAAEVYTLAMM